ncbi:hypothetical protein CEP50_08285 [Actinopolyspora mortivallis]|uniref:DUF2283 domain-containing protein n=1 Tax=Actinopolyspora mortivallis TaxID=33906 RepID=A0A2T0GXC8_ACTMO|nr:hypothetical protein CEP50_08285 [Actinopolyspora mortivallis]
MSASGLSTTGELRVEWTWDTYANAASFHFGRTRSEQVRTFEVCDRDGNTVVLLDFSESGEIVSMELLDAENQIPSSCRE